MVKRRAAEIDSIFDHALSYEFMRVALGMVKAGRPMAALAEQMGVAEAHLQQFMDGGEPDDALWDAGCAATKHQDATRRVADIECVAASLVSLTYPLDQRARVRNALLLLISPTLVAMEQSGTADN